MKHVLTAHIEIPKGGTRRTYLAYDKTGYVDLGPIKDVIPVNHGVMPIHYGFIVGTVNRREESETPEELDVLVYSEKACARGDIVPIDPFALIKREDKDDKIVARVAGEREPHAWQDIPDGERRLILDYFGYKSKIVSVEGTRGARALIEQCRS